MTEPRAKATHLDTVVPDLLRWWVRDDRLGGAESDAHALVDEGSVTLVDPLPIDERLLEELGRVESIVLTASCHQRSSWRFRKRFGAKVYAPEDARGLEEQPDHWYSGGDLLPGRLVAFHAPGPVEQMYALWRARPRGIVFVSDLLAHDGGGTPVFMPDEWQDEPQRTRASVRRIVNDLPVQVLCFNHGPPIVGGARKALEDALESDARRGGQVPAPL